MGHFLPRQLQRGAPPKAAHRPRASGTESQQPGPQGLGMNPTSARTHARTSSLPLEGATSPAEASQKLTFQTLSPEQRAKVTGTFFDAFASRQTEESNCAI